MMAQYLEGTECIPAGNIFAIGGLDDIIFKTATLSSFDCCPSFTPIELGAKAILKVSLTA